MAEMTESEIKALLNAEITDAISYDISTYAGDRIKALEYFDGVLKDIPAEVGRSSVVSTDVADTIGWILPGLMRVFCSTDRVVIYNATKSENDESAKQATEYINYIFLKRCNGYQVLWDAFHDALLLRTGIIKAYWDKKPKYKTKTHRGLSEEDQTQIVADKNTEVIGKDDNSIRTRQQISKGQLAVEAIAPEDYLIDRDATSEETARFHAHKAIKTRSDLILSGYDKEVVKKLPAYASNDSGEKQERFDNQIKGQSISSDSSRDEIEVFECYVLADFNNDDISEWRCVVMAGSSEGREILEQYDIDEHPFTLLTPERVPHRWQGRSIFDQTADVQRIKSALWRQTLDNLYLQNLPQKEVATSQLEKGAIEEILNPTLGGVIRVKGIGAVREIVTPFVAKESFNALSYCDQIIEKRTGVSRSTMQLDPEALQNQSATAANIGQQAAYSKIELIARNKSQQLEKLFSKIYCLVLENQTEAETIRLRDKVIQADPRNWDAAMDVTIDVGIGSGSRDRDMAMLNVVAQKQEQIMLTAGPDNPISGPIEYANTLTKLAESGGIRSPELFFKTPTPESIQAFAQKQAQKPDPKMMEVQAKIQGDQATAQSNAQIKQAELQARLQMDGQKMQAELEMSREKHQNELTLMGQKAQLEAQLRQQEMAHEMQLKRDAMMLTHERESQSTNIKRQEI